VQVVLLFSMFGTDNLLHFLLIENLEPFPCSCLKSKMWFDLVHSKLPSLWVLMVEPWPYLVYFF
jgi:hypothetical protein